MLLQVVPSRSLACDERRDASSPVAPGSPDTGRSLRPRLACSSHPRNEAASPEGTLMEAPTAVGGGVAWRLWALVPIVLLALAVAVVVSQGDRVVDLLGGTPPPADEFDVRRVEFRAGEIRILVRNPQRDDLTIASVTVDDAIVPYMLDGPATLGRLRSSTIVVPYDWVAGRADRRRRHELDGDRDGRGDPRGRAHAAAERARLLRLRPHRAPRRRPARRARAALASVAAPRRSALARGVHGPHRRPADVPRRRGARRGARPAGRAPGVARRAGARPARRRRERARDDVPVRAPLARAGPE